MIGNLSIGYTAIAFSSFRGVSGTTRAYLLVGNNADHANWNHILSPSVGSYTLTGETVARSFGVTFSDRINSKDVTQGGYALALSQGIGLHFATPTYAFRPGAAVSETLGVALTQVDTTTYGLTLADQIRLAATLRNARVVGLAETIGVHEALAALRSAVILEQLFFHDTQSAVATYGLSIMQTVGLHDKLLRFLGAGLVDGIGVQMSPLVNFRPVASVAETLGVADVLANHLILSVTCDERLDLTHDEVLTMIFMPTLTEGIEISAAHIHPGGSYSTWAVNTRTGAVTEYDNFTFNSFARQGARWLGASSDGLYQLDGPDDDGANIVARLKSGTLAFGGSQATSLKGIYLGMRVNDDARDFLLRIETGGGKTLIYKLQPKNMATTKVNIAKGLRTRYLSFELITPGADWDLDVVEFVPIISNRRI